MQLHDKAIDRIRVASPCHARWEDMTGDERARFCGQCRKHVYDLSAMTRQEVETLVHEKEGRFCGRFCRRRDGRMMTADCGVGRRMKRWRITKASAAVLALLTFAAAGTAAGAGQRTGPKSELFQRLDGWIYDLKVRLGIIEPMVMGMVCVPIPPPPYQAPTEPAMEKRTPPAWAESQVEDARDSAVLSE